MGQQGQKLIPELEETHSRSKAGWYLWEKDPNVLSNISIQKASDPNKPPTIVLSHLDFGDSQLAQQLQTAMGDWINLVKEEIPDPRNPKWTNTQYNVYVRGTREAWNKFRQLSSQWLEDDNLLIQKRFQLPSEKEFNPEYQEEKIISPRKPGMGRVFVATALNMSQVPGSIATVALGKKEEPPGIRLQFEPGDSSLATIRDYVKTKEQGTTDKPGLRRGIRYNPQEGYIDVFDLGIGEKKDSSVQWAAVKNKIQDLGYEGTPAMEAMIVAITGISTGKAYEVKAKIDRSKPRNIGETRGAINQNLNADPNKRIPLHPDISNRFGIPEGTYLSKSEFGDLLKQNYPKAFTLPKLVQPQIEGMYHVATREVSILADQPGSGKTAMAVVGAEVTRNQGQKILVISPNMLIAENWTGKDTTGQVVSKAPGQFLDHGPESVRRCNNAQEISAAASDPNVIWIVVPESSLSLAGQKAQDLTRTIKDLSKQGIFSSLIIDEIQRFKLPITKSSKAQKSASLKLKRLSNAISAFYIPHRIGLTGTPSDDNPNNVYAQLFLLRHPVLFKNSGKFNWTEALNDDGFANQFLGGTALSDPIKMPCELSMSLENVESEEEKQEIKDARAMERHKQWIEKAKSVIEWAKNLGDERKLQMLDLFSTTYLRREKEDIDPDLPPLTRDTVVLPRPTDMQLPTASMGWHTKLLKEMAERKAPYTAARAIEYMKNPGQSIFIVTKHPGVADNIATIINQQYGEGSSAAVHEATKQPMRELISETFKAKAVLPGKEVPLRAVVYTMQLGAVGLNFDVASRAIFNDVDWNPSNNIQAEQRTHRITSKQPVNIDYMVFENTYDTEVFERVQRKDAINSSVANLIKNSGLIKDPEKRKEIANDFVKFILENILMDVELTNEEENWFAKELDKALTKPQLSVAAKSIINWYKLTRENS